MANPEEGMFQEALAAIQEGDRARARDLLTRLLKMDQDHADYWLWMSALVETARERLYCLNEVIRIDPNNAAARRGLMIAGTADPDEKNVVPAKLQQRNWETALLGAEKPEKALAASSLRLTLGLAAGLIVLVVVVVVGILAARTPKYGIVYVTEDLSARPSVTFMPTASAVIRSPTPTFIGPTPLWMQMGVTYTPTALYVNTPHPISEAYRIAMRSYARDDWAGMEKYMLQVSTVEPDAADVDYYIGEANRFQKDYTSAASYYNRAIAANPNFAPAYLGRARAKLALDPTARVEPLADLQTAIKKDPNLAEAYIELAGISLADRKYQDALDQLALASPLLPNSPLLPLYRGSVLLKMDKPQEALVEAQAASKLDFTSLPAYRLLAEALQANGRGAESLEPLTTYLTYVSDDAGAFVLLAQANQSINNLAAAMDAYDKAISINPRLVDVYQSRGDLHYYRQEYDAALDDFKYIVQLDKKNYTATMDLGQTYFQLKFYGDAYNQFEIANGLAQNDHEKAQVLYWRGQSLEKINVVDAALRDYVALAKLGTDVADPAWISFAATRSVLLFTPTRTPVTPSATSTLTRSVTPSFTPSSTLTRTQTLTVTPSRTASRTPSATIKVTATTPGNGHPIGDNKALIPSLACA